MVLFTREVRTAGHELDADLKAKYKVEVYNGKTRSGQLMAQGFVGKAHKPAFIYSFKSEEQRADFSKKWAQEQAGREVARELQRQLAAEAKKNFKHDLQIGDIMYASWGYEQTNVDFYQVIARTDKSVTLHKLCSTVETTGHNYGTTLPVKDSFRGDKEPKRHLVSERGSVKLNSYARAYKWDGRPMNCSWGY